jgi:hypothetical protein
MNELSILQIPNNLQKLNSSSHALLYYFSSLYYILGDARKFLMLELDTYKNSGSVHVYSHSVAILQTDMKIIGPCTVTARNPKLYQQTESNLN